MKQNINSQIAIIERSIAWAKKFAKDSFPVEELKEYRRTLRRIANSLEENCSAAAYGESQVGKSYLMSSLLSTADSPFVITNDGKEYSFIDALNPSGGNTSQTESTGVITRFTINNDNETMKDFVKIKNLSVSDLLMLLVDSYYNDLKLDSSKVLLHDAINAELTKVQYLWATKSAPVQDVLTEDDVKDICDYIEDVLGSNTVNITRSDFRKIVAPKIQFVSSENWVKIFSILWNNNEELSHLFSLLVNEFKKINFETEVYVPFEAVLRDKGTLLKIEWLDSVCGIPHVSDTDDLTTDVYNAKGELLATAFNKSSLSALIAELTFVLPKQIANERKFLNKIDLLDFPGARSREKFKEQEISDVLPTILRRGKVAYLFNKYSRSLRISSVLFCHHNDQKSEPSLGDTIIGNTPEKRAEDLARTNGISPLFMIATKFNKELKRTSNDLPNNTEMLAEHWKRFKTVLPEIIRPATWFDNWVIKGGMFRSEAFQSIYMLRDFYWSMETRVFDGYDSRTKSPETNRHIDSDYPDFFENLERSFLTNDFVKRHFADPKKSWDEVSSLNSDGSKAIIRDLDSISGVLDAARREKYLKELKTIRDEIISKLTTYYEPEDKEENNIKTRTIAGDIRLSLDLCIGTKPETFGRIIDKLMIPVSDIRKIAYDIVVLKTEVPVDFNEILLIRTQAKINPSDDKEVSIQKLCNYYAREIDDLERLFTQKGFSIEDVISNECDVAATVADVVSNRILEYWGNFINKQVTGLDKYLPHSDDVAFMLQNLCKRLGVQRTIAERIDIYSRIFPNTDLPNAIADYASLTLNNFVSSIGRSYMSDNDIETIRKKAESCNLEIDLSPEASDLNHKEISVYDALKAFDDAEDPTNVSLQTLMKLPFWDNFQRWKNLLVIGLLYSADVSHCDPVANAEIKKIIDSCKTLYQNQ
jgi:hypothetical protein